MRASLRAVFISRRRIRPRFVYPFLDVAFEPGLFACHLKPHDAPARACAYCVVPRGSREPMWYVANQCTSASTRLIRR